MSRGFGVPREPEKTPLWFKLWFAFCFAFCLVVSVGMLALMGWFLVVAIHWLQRR